MDGGSPMFFRNLLSLYQLAWLVKSHRAQRLAWEDAEEARIARARSERAAAERLQAMLDANPSGQLGNAKLNDLDALRRSGLL
ncbi:hypothetical protein [Methylobacterium trifolii]|uniref:Uncharacterized protein n=1 Tax=Methylobacterium trifolii TaxID=1003092 RepID=A0ABQ4TXQ2_9HYPH|nr:hypothetical protein [Methylobacterium trifolii]GJE59627.1 hypothetical protein MPOCJGCO_1724 [Methylobacterium trifolii]